MKGKVNLNTATVAELRAVGFGAAAAESVVAQRERKRYRGVLELLGTRNIGPKMYERVKDSVYVGEDCPKCGYGLNDEWSFCPKCGTGVHRGENPGGENPGGDSPDWHLYEKVSGDRREYRYGEEWVSMQLLMEGGYPTPEEAKLAWLREQAVIR